jgi:hypothetical protein
VLTVDDHPLHEVRLPIRGMSGRFWPCPCDHRSRAPPTQ